MPPKGKKNQHGKKRHREVDAPAPRHDKSCQALPTEEASNRKQDAVEQTVAATWTRQVINGEVLDYDERGIHDNDDANQRQGDTTQNLKDPTTSIADGDTDDASSDSSGSKRKHKRKKHKHESVEILKESVKDLSKMIKSNNKLMRQVVEAFSKVTRPLPAISGENSEGNDMGRRLSASDLGAHSPSDSTTESLQHSPEEEHAVDQPLPNAHPSQYPIDIDRIYGKPITREDLMTRDARKRAEITDRLKLLAKNLVMHRMQPMLGYIFDIPGQSYHD